MEQNFRLLLYKVTQLLARIDSDQKELHESHLSIIRDGITPYYKTLYEELSPPEACVTSDVTLFVNDILNMYTKINTSINQLTPDEQSILKSYSLSLFEGFYLIDDKEWRYQAYAKFLIRDVKEVSNALDTSAFDDFGTRKSMLKTYRNMLRKYQMMRSEGLLTYDQLLQLLNTDYVVPLKLCN